MRKLLITLIAILALGCDANNRTGERSDGSEPEERAPVESDTSSIHSDTTNTGGLNRPNQYDTLK